MTPTREDEAKVPVHLTMLGLLSLLASYVTWVLFVLFAFRHRVPPGVDYGAVNGLIRGGTIAAIVLSVIGAALCAVGIRQAVRASRSRPRRRLAIIVGVVALVLACAVVVAWLAMLTSM